MLPNTTQSGQIQTLFMTTFCHYLDEALSFPVTRLQCSLKLIHIINTINDTLKIYRMNSIVRVKEYSRFVLCAEIILQLHEDICFKLLQLPQRSEIIECTILILFTKVKQVILKISYISYTLHKTQISSTYCKYAI